MTQQETKNSRSSLDTAMAGIQGQALTLLRLEAEVKVLCWCALHHLVERNASETGTVPPTPEGKVLCRREIVIKCLKGSINKYIM